MSDFGYKDLGWINDWKVTPPEVMACLEKGHAPESGDVGWPNRGHRAVQCDWCHYRYEVDSGD